MTNAHKFDFIALLLVIIGGLNWGLVGLFELDLVAAIFGSMSVLSRIIYILVAIGALYTAVRSPSFAHMHLGRPAHPAT